MELTILNKNVPASAALEQIVNATISLAMEQGVTPETNVEVDEPLTLVSVELTGLSAETHLEVDMRHTVKPDDPQP